MRRWFLLLSLFAAPASAQEASPTPGSPAEATPPPAPPPTPKELAPPAPRPLPRTTTPTTPSASGASAEPERPLPPPQAQYGSAQETIRHDAHALLLLLLAGDARAAAPRLSYPFQLEERRFDTPEPLVAAWVKALRARRTDLVTLYDIEVLPLAEMEKKYGKAPARLGAFVPRGADVYAAVANLSGHAAVLLYRQSSGDWRPFAYTD